MRLLWVSLGLVAYCGVLTLGAWYYLTSQSSSPFQDQVGDRVISVIDDIPAYVNKFETNQTPQATAVRALDRVRKMLNSESHRLFKAGEAKPLLHRTLDLRVGQFLKLTNRGNQLLQSAPQMLLISDNLANRRQQWLSSAKGYCERAPQAFESFLASYRNWIRKPLQVGGVYSPQRSPRGQWEQRLYKLALLNSMVLYANSLPLKALCNLELRTSKKNIEKAMASLEPVAATQRGPLFEAIQSKQVVAARD